MRRNNADYDKEKTYTYYSIDGTAVVLTAGEDGVTEEHIRNLWDLQQEEYNNDRKARRHQLSLERFMDDQHGKNSSNESCLRGHGHVVQAILSLRKRVHRFFSQSESRDASSDNFPKAV